MPGELFFVDNWTYVKVTGDTTGESYYFTVRSFKELQERMMANPYIASDLYHLEQIDLIKLEMESIMRNLTTDDIIKMCVSLKK